MDASRERRKSLIRLAGASLTRPAIHFRGPALIATVGCPVFYLKDEVNLKNIAGNDVSIFLFRFELRGYGIDFVLNEVIAADMYPDIDEKMKPLVHACCETLLRYKRLSVGNTIMDGNILTTGEFEVMLSKGLGRYFAHDEKQRLFQDAKIISDLLGELMGRRTQELKNGEQ